MGSKSTADNFYLYVQEGPPGCDCPNATYWWDDPAAARSGGNGLSVTLHPGSSTEQWHVMLQVRACARAHAGWVRAVELRLQLHAHSLQQ